MSAALVLCVSAVAKLRSPASAALALRTLGLPGTPALARGLGFVELIVGAGAAARPSRPLAAALCVLYAGFCMVSLALVRKRSTCGCFGESDTPASVIQAVLSGGFALVALAATLRPAHGMGWVFARAPGITATLAFGIAGLVYAIVVAYTELPRAWAAWGSR